MSSEQHSPLAVGRQQTILDELSLRGQVSATALADRFGVTHETIRKDLTTLQQRGLLRRVHGGAVPSAPLRHEAPVRSRTSMAEEKARIGMAAHEFLPSSGAVLIDSGSTTTAFAEHCPPAPDVLAFTNSLPIALLLLHTVGGVSILGGRVRPTTEATVDEWALQSLRSLRADVAFLGTNAFSVDHGLATPDDAESVLKRELVRSAQLRVLLADHTKFGRESVFRYADLADIDVLVTDAGLPDRDARDITARAGVEVVRA